MIKKISLYLSLIFLLGSLGCKVSNANLQSNKADSVKTSMRQVQNGNTINPFKTVKGYGAKGDGKTDDTRAIQAAIDSGNEVIFERGIYLTTMPLIIRERTLISGKKAQITYTGRDAAIKAEKLVWDVTINNLGIEATADNAKAVDFSQFSYSHLDDMYLIIKGKNSTGLYMQGNGIGSGPYYNSFTNLYIIGSNNPKITNQRGIVLDETTKGGLSANGANGNIFTNIKRIAGLSIAVDLISGNGNMFSNINTESIQDYHFRFNNRPPDFTGKISQIENNSVTDSKQDFGRVSKADIVIKKRRNSEVRTSKITGFKKNKLTTEAHRNLADSDNADYELYKCKALGNVFNNIRVEGSGKSVFAKFCHGAADNRFSDVVLSSIGPLHIERETEDFSNRIGTPIPLVFQMAAVPANKTIDLFPTNSYRGGMPIGMNCYIDAVQIKNTTAKNPGTCTVNLARSVAPIPLSVKLTPADRNTATAITKKYIPSSYGLLRPNDGLQVSITTDAAWKTDDIIITIWITEL